MIVTEAREGPTQHDLEPAEEHDLDRERQELQHDDDEFRTLVDRALSKAYASADFAALYSKWCGEFDERARTFFAWNTLPE